MNLNESTCNNASRVQLRKCWEGQQKQEEEHDGGMMRCQRKLKQNLLSDIINWNSLEENSLQNTVCIEVKEANRASTEVKSIAYESWTKSQKSRTRIEVVQVCQGQGRLKLELVRCIKKTKKVEYFGGLCNEQEMEKLLLQAL